MAGFRLLAVSGGRVVLTGFKRANISRYIKLCWALAGAEVGNSLWGLGCFFFFSRHDREQRYISVTGIRMIDLFLL